jgi:hypothetical protein
MYSYFSAMVILLACSLVVFLWKKYMGAIYRRGGGHEKWGDYAPLQFSIVNACLVALASNVIPCGFQCLERCKVIAITKHQHITIPILAQRIDY